MTAAALRKAASILVERIAGAAGSEGWPSVVHLSRWRRPFTDRECFTNANIILTLRRCRWAASVAERMTEPVQNLINACRLGHLTYIWPLKRRRPTCFHSVLLGRAVNYSPDADGSCLTRLVDRDEALARALAGDLARHRFDQVHFTLVQGQRRLRPFVDDTFTTWFPPYPRGRPRPETADVVVDAHVLWFLSEYRLTDLEGVAATIHFIRWVVGSGLVIADPFLVSPYYPYPAVILYMLSRAIVWGGLAELKDCRPGILAAAERLDARSALDRLLLASVGCLWGDFELVRRHQEGLTEVDYPPEPIFMGHFALGTYPWSFDLLARRPWFQFTFSSPAWQWAVHLYLLEQSARHQKAEGVPTL